MNTFLKNLVLPFHLGKDIKSLFTSKTISEFNGKRNNLQFPEAELYKPQSHKIYIIHGGKEDDYKLKLCIKFLNDSLYLEPIVHKPSRSSFYFSALSLFDRVCKDCSAAIVIFSPDIETHAVKQNILLEFGYFLGKFQNEKERKIIILYNRDTVVPADFYGIPCIAYRKSVRETFYQLKSQFRSWSLLT
jgi:predicted nucleotide-binding protein